jgi:hypothetical protein
MIIGELNEETTGKYTAQLTDEDDNNIPLVSMSALTLTLYDFESGVIINLREDQDVLNANNVTVGSTGVLTWVLQPEDNPILDDNLDVEIHVALFQGVYSGGKQLKHETSIAVKNLTKVT